jgi:hypothetical protein
MDRYVHNRFDRAMLTVCEDTAAPFMRQKLDDMLLKLLADSSDLDEDVAVRRLACMSRLKHISCQNLAKLFVMFAHTPPKLDEVMSQTDLLVIDDITAPFKLQFAAQMPTMSSADQSTKEAQTGNKRKWAFAADMVACLGKLAATKNLAVLIISQVTTIVRAETGAVLRPGLEGTAWETAISSRVVLFRQRIFSDTELLQDVRCAGVTKAQGIYLCENGGLGRIAFFRITKVSLFCH